MFGSICCSQFDYRHSGLLFSKYSHEHDDFVFQVGLQPRCVSFCPISFLLQRAPNFDLLSDIPSNVDVSQSTRTPQHGFPSLSLNLSVGLSSFAEADVMKSRVLAAAGAAAEVSCDDMVQELGFAPNWGNADSFFSANRCSLFLFCASHSMCSAAATRIPTYACNSINTELASVNAASGLPALPIIPGRTWLVTVPVIVKVRLLPFSCSFGHSFSPAIAGQHERWIFWSGLSRSCSRRSDCSAANCHFSRSSRRSPQVRGPACDFLLSAKCYYFSALVINVTSECL
jgi:hypothetical protein